MWKTTLNNKKRYIVYIIFVYIFNENHLKIYEYHLTQTKPTFVTVFHSGTMYYILLYCSVYSRSCILNLINWLIYFLVITAWQLHYNCQQLLGKCITAWLSYCLTEKDTLKKRESVRDRETARTHFTSDYRFIDRLSDNGTDIKPSLVLIRLYFLRYSWTSFPKMVIINRSESPVERYCNKKCR